MKNYQPDLKTQSNYEIMNKEVEYNEGEAFEDIRKDFKQFENKTNPNLEEIEAINLGDHENIRETKISVHVQPQQKKAIIEALHEYKDIFVWSYDDMPGLSTDLVVHKLPMILFFLLSSKSKVSSKLT